MSIFSQYVQSNNLLVSIKDVLLSEIDKNIANKRKQLAQLNDAKCRDKSDYNLLVRNFGFNVYECQDVLNAMVSDRDNLANKILDPDIYAVKDSDKAIRGAFGLGCQGKVLDVVSLISSQNSAIWIWSLGDCKLELKTDGENLFGDAMNFNHRVVEKFENVQFLLKNDNEKLIGARIIVVTTAVSKVAANLLARLKLGSIQPQIVREDYQIVTPLGVVSLLTHLKNQVRRI